MSKSENQKLFAERRKELVDRQLSNSEALDKAVLTLSSSGLAISISFIRYIIDLESAIKTNLLFTSWALFALAIICTITSYLIGQKAIEKSIDISYKYYIEDDDRYENVIPLSSRINDKINLLSSVFFIMAVVSVVSFVAINLNKQENAMSKEKSNSTFTADSATIPKMQKKSAAIPKQQPKTKPKTESTDKEK